MKKVYFIRHGETRFNKEHRHQPGDTPLTEKGRKQAQSAQKFLASLPLSHIITSPYTRAKETATIAAEGIDIPIEENELFVELVRPGFVIGKTHGSIVSFRYIFSWFFKHDTSYWKKNGGESRLLFLNRIHDAKEYLESIPSDAQVVIFSHSVFINFFIEHICNEKPISFGKALLLFLKIKSLNNSSASELVYDSNAAPGTCAWRVERFDDDSHLHT